MLSSNDMLSVRNLNITLFAEGLRSNFMTSSFLSPILNDFFKNFSGKSDVDYMRWLDAYSLREVYLFWCHVYNKNPFIV